MPRIMTFFDYVFYRGHRYFIGRNDDAAAARATDIVAILQAMLIMDLYLFLVVFDLYELPARFKSKWLALPLIVVIMVWNHFRYKHKLKDAEYSLLQQKWDNEDKRKSRVRGWLIVLLGCFLIWGALPLMLLLRSL